MNVTHDGTFKDAAFVLRINEWESMLTRHWRKRYNGMGMKNQKRQDKGNKKNPHIRVLLQDCHNVSQLRTGWQIHQQECLNKVQKGRDERRMRVNKRKIKRHGILQSKTDCLQTWASSSFPVNAMSKMQLLKLLLHFWWTTQESSTGMIICFWCCLAVQDKCDRPLGESSGLKEGAHPAAS